MPDAQDSRAAIIERLQALFGAKGFDGVSIGDLSEATGLGRSSLYHHFPGGKDEMAEAVVAHTRAGLERAVFAPLAQDRPIAARVDAMLDMTAKIYAGGANPCVLASLMGGAGEGRAAGQAAGLLRDWSDALARALQSAGLDTEEANRRAVLALGQIQGALVFARVLRNKDAFAEALRAARAALLGGLS